jgi:hypothetical protein
MVNVNELILNKGFVIDPSIEYEDVLKELITQFKISLICYQDNEEILTNLYYTMKVYFNPVVVDEIIHTTLTLDQYRNLIIDDILKNKENDVQ